MTVHRSRARLRAAAASLAALVCTAAPAGDDLPMRAMKDELARSLGQLRLRAMERPYFVAYRLDDVQALTVSATLGSLTSAQPARARIAGVELRVGDYALDNGNYLGAGASAGGGGVMGIGQAPLDDSYREIRRQFWLTTDAQYKRALEDLSAKRAALQARKRADDVPDFTREPAVTLDGAFQATRGPGADLAALAREISAVFRATPEISRSSVRIEWLDVRTRYANGEGTSFTRSSPSLKLNVQAETQAADGLPISDSIVVHGRSAADLPPRDAILSGAREMAARILALRSAATLERYSGPVLFEGPAAAEIFCRQFAPALLAVRRPVSDDSRLDAFYGQMAAQFGGGSFAGKMGGRVLPEFLGVTDDPLRSDYQGTPLLGGQAIDDDGVVPRRTRLVEHGVLKALLASRVPVLEAPRSTGSRRAWGPAPSNLLVASDRTLGGAELRKELLRAAKARGLDHAIVVRRVGGGDATASLARLAARMGAPVEGGSSALAQVYRIHPDGREEILRGVELAEMPLAAFKDVTAAGDVPAVFTGEFVPRLGQIFALGLGAGGGAPVVSCVAPSMLFDEVSLARSQGPFPAPPVSPSPLAPAP